MSEKKTMYLDQIISPDELSDEDKQAARKLVATFSTGVEDCRDLLEMLGLQTS